MIVYDLHLHSKFSTDSAENPETVVEKAIRLGLKGICFTDHMDLYFPLQCSKKSGGDFTFDLEEYFETLSFLKRKYMGQLEIFYGLEIGLRNEPELLKKCYEEYCDMVKRYPFDFVIGSTHCLENIDPYWEEYWDGKTTQEGLDRYFDAIAQNCSYYDCFDSLGHLDYLIRYVPQSKALEEIKQCGIYEQLKSEGMEDDEKRLYGRRLFSPEPFYEIIENILKTVIDRGKALEINSAGFKYGLGFAHPKQQILKMYRNLGGELITVGSDAHMAEHLAYDFNEVCSMLKDLGFKYYFVYKNRKPEGYLL